MAVKRLCGLALVAVMTSAASGCGDDIRTADSGSDANTDPDSGTDAGDDSGVDTETDTGPGDTSVWVTAGYMHSCAVIDGGYVKCWGDQQWGELGYGPDLDDLPDADTSLPSTLPFVDVGAPVAEIEGGINHTCALLADGTAKCWGADGDVGVLGVDMGGADTIGKYDVPADHASIDFGVPILEISTGGTTTCVLLEGGSVVCFGEEENGKLGYGDAGYGYDVSNPPSSEPLQLGGPAKQISTGLDHTCAVLENGDVLCWGSGGGSLGYGNTETVGDDEVPVDVGPVELGGPAVQVSAGTYHTCAVLESGEVLCWGLGLNGELGYGNTDTVGDDEVPASIGPVDVGAPVVEITTGERITCVRLVENDVKCWGAIACGLGYTVGDDETPAEAETVPLGGKAVHLSAGSYHVCALLEDGGVRCWGYDNAGSLGYGPDVDYIGDDETPAEMGDVQLF